MIIDKEVVGYYEDGMRVPDDVTLLWSDDKWGSLSTMSSIPSYILQSWGNMVRLPLPNEFNRTGGAGVYYHVCNFIMRGLETWLISCILVWLCTRYLLIHHSILSDEFGQVGVPRDYKWVTVRFWIRTIFIHKCLTLRSQSTQMSKVCRKMLGGALNWRCMFLDIWSAFAGNRTSGESDLGC